MVLPSSNTISSAWFRPFGSRCRCCAQLVHPQRHCQARLDLPHLPHRKPPQLMTVSTFHYVNDVSMFDGIQRTHWCRAQSMQYQVTFYLFFWAVADVIVVVVSRVDCQPLPWRFEWTAALLSQAAVHGSDPTARVLTPSVGQVARSPRQRLADRTRGPGPSEETHTDARKHDGVRPINGRKGCQPEHQCDYPGAGEDTTTETAPGTKRKQKNNT